jgi:hypothetical protein
VEAASDDREEVREDDPAVALDLVGEIGSDVESISSFAFCFALGDDIAVGRGSESTTEVALGSASRDRIFSPSSGAAGVAISGGFKVLYPPIGPSKVLAAVTKTMDTTTGGSSSSG